MRRFDVVGLKRGCGGFNVKRETLNATTAAKGGCNIVI
jgi:hypothetical protein